MSRTLVVAELQGEVVRNATYSAITLAKRLNGPFAIVAFGSRSRAAAEALVSYGAEKVLIVDDAAVDQYVCERYAPSIATITRNGGFDTVVVTATAFGKDLAPRLAARLDAGYAADISAVEVTDGKRTYCRPIYAGNAYAWLEIDSPIHVVSVRQTEFAPAQPSGAKSTVDVVPLAPSEPAGARIEFIRAEVGKSERPDLGEARVVVSGGRALKEQFSQVLEPLADALGAAIGASRAACDAGFAPPELQVGQTGRTVAPQLYFAIGISGAIQHIAGMKGSKVIVAINKDPDAPIFQIADYGLVQDLFVAVPELVKELRG
ncbi:MAG TPA: electron transfer flavoprotein subunit alpha/FixB family protein [Polyangiaceae bacterium]|nr:electron transfer flavoprotein subunit alpha/FixB family protein [Polyangiaceae bacterium]